ncbi:MAG: rhamnan synthesis F family protein [Candidatus Methylacidiphilales bacterium]|nr:rhamnan synthesis F family protein [Candidatus Methylacidiphilales bacterium]
MRKLPSPPEEFDESTYLSENHDVLAAVSKGFFSSGWHHYFEYGIFENRPGGLTGKALLQISCNGRTNEEPIPRASRVWDFLKRKLTAWIGSNTANHRHMSDSDVLLQWCDESASGPRAGLPGVVVFTHELSRTGAPMIALGLVRWLSTKYRVIVFSITGGALHHEFEAASDRIILLSQVSKAGNESLGELLFALQKRIPLRYAIVNSIACSNWMNPIVAAGLPVLLLVHEEPDEYLSFVNMHEMLTQPARIICTGKKTAERWLATNHQWTKRTIHCLPQSVRQIPCGPLPDSIQSWGKPIKIILGVGTVEPRKGVDRFLECAASLVQLNPSFDFRFVWVGKRTPPAIPPGYQSVLKRIIQATNLDDRICFVDETEAIGAFYERADLFFLSSLVDVVSCVALEAMSVGTPVIAFDESSGVADEMKKNPALQSNVVPFMATRAAAERILYLLSNPETYASNVAASRRFSAGYLPGKFEACIDAWGNEAAELNARELSFVEQITKECSCDARYFLGRPPKNNDEVDWSARIAVRSIAAGALMRRIQPGVLPVSILNPFREKEEVEITSSGNAGSIVLDGKQTPGKRRYRNDVAAHCHFYFPQTIEPIFKAACRNETTLDWWISIGGDVTESMVRETADRLGISGLQAVDRVPNLGRDIGPMIVHFREALKSYAIIGHFHGKESNHYSNRRSIEQWNRVLIENTLGGQTAAIDQILAFFDREPALGLVFPDDPLLDRWAGDWPRAAQLAEQLKIPMENPRGFEFPVGNMFWARTKALAPLLDFHWQWENLPVEPLSADGTMLHLLERLTPFIVRATGYHHRTTTVPGIMQCA